MGTATVAPSRANSAPPGQPGLSRKQVVAVGIGNFMEWFDFAIYGYFAAIIGSIYFPSDATGVSLLSSLAVFAVGFVSRPFGALILGPIGDRFGRKTVLMITVFGMGVFTTLIGLLPGYDTIGITAPILLVVLRFLQGMMVGGEWSAAGIFLVESAPANRRASAASVVTFTAGVAFLLGTATAAAINATLTEAQVYSWGWRVPFVLSIVMTFIAVFIRRKLNDTPVYHELQEKKANNTLERVSSKDKLNAFVLSFAFSALFLVSLYYFITYANNHLVSILGMSKTSALWLCSASLVVYCILHPLVGRFSDHYGRRKLALFAAAGLTVMAYPIFVMMNSGKPALILLGLIIMAFLVAISAVMNVVLLVEVFPASIRSTGAALGHNVSSALLAGPGPFIAAALIQYTGNPNVPAWYLAAVSLVCFLILYTRLPETKNVDLSAG
ncbi:MFS transporter [Alcaligenes parafaecalis]|uniref:MFS transporter n=1 Tax=Alcaligenes parafaecalis TaxID=171260 RepID=A0ABT3VKY1_9BURK|nr:MFS transporter [Alcaligenes parafaecalis]MCX5464164.1 MFS transporter [Alcaligenes parafaecalis]